MRVLARSMSLTLLAVIGDGDLAFGRRAPTDLVKSAAERAIKGYERPQAQVARSQRITVSRASRIINPIFDYQEMARRCMGRHWRQRTPAEQEEFYNLFRDFLEQVYSSKVDFYDGEKVSFGRETIDGDFAEVESTVVNAKGIDKPRDLPAQTHRRTCGEVYDAVIENISIVNNYRCAIRSGDIEIFLRRTSSAC
jgi:phospholipid transport system substrate-binding protein